MTRSLARLALGLGLAALLAGAVPAAMAQTTTTAPDATAPATEAAPPAQGGMSMGVPDGMPDQAHAQAGQIYLAAKFDAWEERCVKQSDGAGGDPCQLYQLLKDQTGNPVIEFSIFPLPDGGQAAFGATIMAPLETQLTSNMRIVIDQATAKFYPFAFCNAAGCIAKVGFTPDELAAMKKGKATTVTIVPAAAPDKTVTATMTLKGFSDGYQAIKDAQAKVKK